MAMAESKDFKIGIGTQHCAHKDGIKTCGGTDFKIHNETLDLEGNIPWQKEFGEFLVTVMVKRRAPHHIVRVNIYSDDGTSLGSYATNIDSLDDLNTIKLGSGQHFISETESVRGWVSLEVQTAPQP